MPSDQLGISNNWTAAIATPKPQTIAFVGTSAAHYALLHLKA